MCLCCCCRSNPNTCTLPVILLSARAGPESSVEGLEQGADDYLIKPFAAKELLASSPLISHTYPDFDCLTNYSGGMQARVASHLSMADIRMEATKREHQLRLQIHHSQQFLEKTLNSIRDAFVSVDNNLCYTFVNENAAQVVGSNREGKCFVVLQCTNCIELDPIRMYMLHQICWARRYATSCWTQKTT